MPKRPDALPMSDGARLPRRGLWALLAAAALLRLAYFAERRDSPFFATPALDERYYDGMARALAEGGDLRRYGGFRPMLYPLFLALPYRAAGAEAGRLLAILLQHALGVATVGLVARSGARLARDARAGLWAGALYAAAGPPLYFEGELLIASLMAFLAAAAVGALMAAASTEGPGAGRRWALAGAWIGLGAQARPNILPVLALFPVWALWRVRRGGGRAAGRPLAGLGAALAVVLAFAPIHRLQSGRRQILPGAGGINLYVGNNAQADGLIPRQPSSVVFDEEYLDSLQIYADREYRRRCAESGISPSEDPAAVSRFWTRETLREIRTAPGRWLRLMARKIRYLLWNHEAPNNKSYSFALARESRLLNVLPTRWCALLALAPLGLWRARARGGGPAAVALAGFAALYGAGIALFFVNARFRIPLWPALAMAAGGGAAGLWEAARARNGRRFLPAAGAAAALALISRSPVPGAPPDDWARDLFLRANARLDRGDPDGALADIRESLSLDPENADARLTLGNALFGRGDFAGAAEAYREYVRRDPDEPRGWNNLGAALSELGAWPDAYRAYLRALELRPSHRSARLNAAFIEWRAGRRDLAARRLESLADEIPDHVPLRIALAALAESRGDTARADAWRSGAYARDANAAERARREWESPLRIPLPDGAGRDDP